MKKLQHYYWNLLSAGALFGMVAIFLTGPAQSDDNDTKIKVKEDGDIKVKGEDGKVKIDGEDGKMKVKGDDPSQELATARAILSEQEAAEFKASLVQGYTIPKERYVYLEPLPETYAVRVDPVPEGMVYRYYDGYVYTVNPKTYTVTNVMTFDQ